MAYMAPEVLRKKGYFATVDWWSLGVVCFELLFGKRPFRGKSNSALTDSILHDELRFPSTAETKVSPPCIAAIRAVFGFVVLMAVFDKEYRAKTRLRG